MTIIILIYNPREQPLFYFVPVPVKSRDGTQVLLTSAPHLLRCSRYRCSSGRDGCGKEISAREEMLEEAEVRKHAR